MYECNLYNFVDDVCINTCTIDSRIREDWDMLNEEMNIFWNAFKYYKKIRKLVGDDDEAITNDIKRRVRKTERDSKVMKLVIVDGIHKKSNWSLVKDLLNRCR